MMVSGFGETGARGLPLALDASSAGSDPRSGPRIDHLAALERRQERRTRWAGRRARVRARLVALPSEGQLAD